MSHFGFVFKSGNIPRSRWIADEFGRDVISCSLRSIGSMEDEQFNVAGYTADLINHLIVVQFVTVESVDG